MYSNYEIGMRIQELRRKKGMTQEVLAAEVDISDVFMAKIESGIRGCSLTTLIKFSDFFHVSLDYLILGKKTAPEIEGELDAAMKILSDLRAKI